MADKQDTTAEEPHLPCSDSPDPRCEDVNGHNASGSSFVHLRKGLLELLYARRFALRVNPQDVAIEGAIRGTLGLVCGFDWPGMAPHRKEVVERTSLDELFRQRDLELATAAGCGFLYLKDGSKKRGAGVDWDE